MRGALVLLLACLCLGGTARAAELQNGPGRYAPRDECARLPGAAAFRAALANAAKRRDVEALVALASPNVELDFGGGAGRDELRRQLREPMGRERRQALDRMEPLGCAVQGGNLVLPWFFAQEIGDLEPYDTLLVTGAGVPLRSRPSPTAPVVRSLTWQLTQAIAPDDGKGPYRHVRLPGTRIGGYVATANLRSPVDYRLIAGRSGGRWRIDAFIAGD